jgi:hypothetical protein
MTKRLLTFGILIVVLTGVFAPTIAFGQGISGISGAFGPVGILASLKVGDWSLSNAIFSVLFTNIALFLMSLSSLVLSICGWGFDAIIKFTITDMAKNVGDPKGVGGAITTAWATLRDIANMCFIFVLLYAAFKAMFDTNFGNFGKTVKDIIIVALLINFSLFFSKVVIDASNIVSVGFYNSIVTSQSSLTSGSTTNNFNGISAGYMNMLRLQTFFSPEILKNPNLGNPTNVLIIGVLSSVFMLITAIILLMAGVMFAARFIILIFIMILSPLALIAYIIPGMKGQYDKWKNALIDQSFFAPLYFALTWVVFKLGTSLLVILDNDPTKTTGQWTDLTTNPHGIMTLIVNYVLIMGFSIAALIFAKQMASKTAGFKQISGGIGAVALGGAALAGRNAVGRASSLISETQREKWSKSSAGRAGLWLANKGGKASFDARGIAETKLGKAAGAGKMMDIAGKTGGKGGFVAAVDAKVKAKAKYAKDVYGQTDAEKDEAKKLEKTYNTEKFIEETKIKEERLAAAQRRLKEAKTDEEKAREDRRVKYVENLNKKNIFEDDEYKSEEFKKVKEEYERYAKAGEKRQEAFAKRLESSANILTAAGSVVGAIGGGLVGGIPGAAIGAGIGAGLGRGNKAAARKIKLESKGPSKEKKLADAYKDIAETETPAAETPAAETPAAASATGHAPEEGGASGAAPTV